MVFSLIFFVMKKFILSSFLITFFLTTMAKAEEVSIRCQIGLNDWFEKTLNPELMNVWPPEVAGSDDEWLEPLPLLWWSDTSVAWTQASLEWQQINTVVLELGTMEMLKVSIFLSEPYEIRERHYRCSRSF